MATVELPAPAGVRRDPFPRPWTPAEFDRARTSGAFGDRAAELIDGQILERIDGELRPFMFTRKEYYALDVLSGERVELIAGEILQMPRMNPPHAQAVRKVTKALGRISPEGHFVQAQLPLDLGLTTEPLPDVSVIHGSEDGFGDEHPHAAVLVVEVSDTTFDFDAFEKASLYAAAGIAEYWVVDLTRGRLVVLRDPKPREEEVYRYAYTSLAIHESDAEVAPLAAPTASVRVADLLP
jgi:Uma2 family endonuclease